MERKHAMELVFFQEQETDKAPTQEKITHVPEKIDCHVKWNWIKTNSA